MSQSNTTTTTNTNTNPNVNSNQQQQNNSQTYKLKLKIATNRERVLSVMRFPLSPPPQIHKDNINHPMFMWKEELTENPEARLEEILAQKHGRKTQKRKRVVDFLQRQKEKAKERAFTVDKSTIGAFIPPDVVTMSEPSNAQGNPNANRSSFFPKRQATPSVQQQQKEKEKEIKKENAATTEKNNAAKKELSSLTPIVDSTETETKIKQEQMDLDVDTVKKEGEEEEDDDESATTKPHLNVIGRKWHFKDASGRHFEGQLETQSAPYFVIFMENKEFKIMPINDWWNFKNVAKGRRVISDDIATEKREMYEQMQVSFLSRVLKSDISGDLEDDEHPDYKKKAKTPARRNKVDDDEGGGENDVSFDKKEGPEEGDAFSSDSDASENEPDMELIEEDDDEEKINDETNTAGLRKQQKSQFRNESDRLLGKDAKNLLKSLQQAKQDDDDDIDLPDAFETILPLDQQDRLEEEIQQEEDEEESAEKAAKEKKAREAEEEASKPQLQPGEVMDMPVLSSFRQTKIKIAHTSGVLDNVAAPTPSNNTNNNSNNSNNNTNNPPAITTNTTTSSTPNNAASKKRPADSQTTTPVAQPPNKKLKQELTSPTPRGGSSDGPTHKDIREQLLLHPRITTKGLIKLFKSRLDTQVKKNKFTERLKDIARTEAEGGETYVILKDEYKFLPLQN